MARRGRRKGHTIRTAGRAQARARAGAERRGPTRQTVAKLKPDPLWTLARRGTLSGEQVQAAWDIRAAFEIITVPVRLRLSALEKIDGGSLDYMETRRVRRLIGRYNDWVEEMTRRRLPTGPVLDIVIEGRSCREVDHARRVRKGTARELLCVALDLYCRVAGWPASRATLDRVSAPCRGSADRDVG